MGWGGHKASIIRGWTSCSMAASLCYVMLLQTCAPEGRARKEGMAVSKIEGLQESPRCFGLFQIKSFSSSFSNDLVLLSRCFLAVKNIQILTMLSDRDDCTLQDCIHIVDCGAGTLSIALALPEPSDVDNARIFFLPAMMCQMRV